MFQTQIVGKIKTRILCSITFFPPENCSIYEIMLENMVKPNGPHVTIQYGPMRFA